MKQNPLDADSFARLHREHRVRLVGSLIRFVHNQDKAEDLAAQAFQTAWQKREGFRGEASDYTWVQAIARNHALQAERGVRSFRFDSLDRPDAAEVAAPGLVTDELERREERFRLQKALNQLSARHRHALIGHFVEGLSIREIADRERVPTGTVLSRIHRGKELLRDAWNNSQSRDHVSWDR